MPTLETLYMKRADDTTFTAHLIVGDVHANLQGLANQHEDIGDVLQASRVRFLTESELQRLFVKASHGELPISPKKPGINNEGIYFVIATLYRDGTGYKVVNNNRYTESGNPVGKFRYTQAKLLDEQRNLLIERRNIRYRPHFSTLTCIHYLRVYENPHVIDIAENESSSADEEESSSSEDGSSSDDEKHKKELIAALQKDKAEKTALKKKVDSSSSDSSDSSDSEEEQKKEKAQKTAPKKVETNSSDSSDSSDSDEEQQTTKVLAKEPPSKLKDDSSSEEEEESSSDEEEPAPAKKQPTVLKNLKEESSSSEDGSSSDDEKHKKELIAALQKEKAEKTALRKKVYSSSSDSSDSEEEQKKERAQKTAPKKVETNCSDSSDSPDSDEEQQGPAPAKKQPTVEKAKAESDSSEEETSSDEESDSVKKQPATLKNAKAENSSSEEESSSDETRGRSEMISESIKRPVRTLFVSELSKDVTTTDLKDFFEEAGEILQIRIPKDKGGRTSGFAFVEFSSRKEAKEGLKLQSKPLLKHFIDISLAHESGEESNEDSKDENKTRGRSKTTSESALAKKKHTGSSSSKKQPTLVQKTTPAAKVPSSKTLFAGNLSYEIERSDLEHFFKEVSEVVDVRLSSHNFKGFGHVVFASAEAAQKALNLNGRSLLGRNVRLELAHERSANNTQRSSHSGGIGGGSQGQRIFVTGFDSSLSESEIKHDLRTHFSTCGEVARISVPTDPETGAFKGIAFIDMVDGFMKALKLSGSQIRGWKIVVYEARPRGESRAK